jgi:hypothetical protein
MNFTGKLIFFLVILLLYNSACILSQQEKREKQSYQYTAYDSLGKAIVQGTLTINFADSGSAQGQWDFFELHPISYRGPQVGEGELIGNLSKNQIWINLNPHYADNNVMLQGELNNKKITGRWSWITIIGPTSSGDFDAIEK